MKWKTNLILFLFLILSADKTMSQTAWRHIDGLPCEETSSVTQDDKGYIWIGTRLGLLRYDGYSIKTYRNDLAHPYTFSSCNILCLAPDSDDCVWAGSFYGLNRFSTDSGQATPTHFGGNDHVGTICIDRSKRRWVGTDTGLYMATPETDFEHFGTVPRDIILQIRELPEGQIAVVTGHHGLYTIDPQGNCMPIAASAALSVTAVCPSSDGALWVGTKEQGLYLLRDGRAEHVPSLDHITINDLLPHPQGRSLIVATNRGVFSLSEGTPTPTLSVPGVKSLFADKNGNVWASTENQGVFFLKNQSTVISVGHPSFVKQTEPIISQFSIHHLADTVLWSRIKGINAIYEAADGQTYIGTRDDGIYITEKGAVREHLTENHTPWLNTNSIYAFAALDQTTLLIGTWFGLYVMKTDGSSGQHLNSIGNSDISTMHTLTVTAISHDDIWLGLVGGIAHIEGALTSSFHPTITLYTHEGNKGRKDVEDIGQLTNLHDETGDYQLGGIYRIVKDQQGRIWACTSEPGLLLYDAEHDIFRSVSDRLGILGDNVHSLDIDANGTFWMTTNYGILQMNIDHDGKPGELQLYTRRDGLPSDYYGSTMSCVLGNRTLCFLNQQCLVTIAPKPLTPTLHTKAFISELYVNNAPYSGIEHKTHRLTLSHSQNNLSLRFTTLSLGREASVRYFYRLDGIDNEYHQTDMGANSISYHQLPPGSYTLHYYSQNNMSDPPIAEEMLIIEILQPWWWRWWAKTGYALILAAIATLIFHNVSDRRKKQHQLKALETEKQQQEQLYQKKVHFYVRVLHDFLTPLTLMSDLAHDLHGKVRPSLQASMFMLSNQTDQLLESMNNIVDVKDDTSASEALKKAQEMTQVDRDFLRRCTESVNAHISDPHYSHTVMMAEVGASHATLYRKLKALTSMDATTFIRSIRMRAAYQILSANPNIRISELAENVGYNNARYFSTCFKNEYGISPRECITTDIQPMD